MSFDLSRWLCCKSAVLAASLFVVLHAERAASKITRSSGPDPGRRVDEFSRLARALALMALCLASLDAGAGFPATPLKPAPWTETTKLMCSSCAASAWCTNEPTLVQTTIEAMAAAHAALKQLVSMVVPQ